MSQRGLLPVGTTAMNSLATSRPIEEQMPQSMSNVVKWSGRTSLTAEFRVLLGNSKKGFECEEESRM